MFGFAFIIVIATVEVVRKEEHPQNSKHNEQFDEYNQPKSFPNSHVAKTFVEEAK